MIGSASSKSNAKAKPKDSISLTSDSPTPLFECQKEDCSGHASSPVGTKKGPMESPPQEMNGLESCDQLARAIASFSLSSPELYISIRMSEPPMNSPLTYTWGMVGHSEYSLMP